MALPMSLHPLRHTIGGIHVTTSTRQRREVDEMDSGNPFGSRGESSAVLRCFSNVSRPPRISRSSVSQSSATPRPDQRPPPLPSLGSLTSLTAFRRHCVSCALFSTDCRPFSSLPCSPRLPPLLLVRSLSTAVPRESLVLTALSLSLSPALPLRAFSSLSSSPLLFLLSSLLSLACPLV